MFQNWVLGLIHGYLEKGSKNSVHIRSTQQNLNFYPTSMMERSLRHAPNKHKQDTTVNYLNTELILFCLVELVKIALY